MRKRWLLHVGRTDGLLRCLQADASIAELETQLQQAQLQYSQEAAAAQQLRLDLVDEKQRAQSMNATLQASVESATAEAVTMEHRRCCAGLCVC